MMKFIFIVSDKEDLDTIVHFAGKLQDNGIDNAEITIKLRFPKHWML